MEEQRDPEMDQEQEMNAPRQPGEPAGTPEMRMATATAPDPVTVASAGTPAPAADRSDLLGDGELTALRDRWAGLQTMFVDDPAQATRHADTMVGDVLDHLRSRHRELHDRSHGANGQADTEAMRVEFLRYRSFLRVLLG